MLEYCPMLAPPSQVNSTLTPPPHNGIRPLMREDFTPEDMKGLKRCLKRDPFHPTVSDVGKWLRSGDWTMWRCEANGASLGLLLQRTDQSALCLTYIWGKGLRAASPAILLGMQEIARIWGLKYLTATFASRRLLRVFRGARIAYYYGIYEVE